MTFYYIIGAIFQLDFIYEFMGDKMELYLERMEKARNDNKMIYFDYINYKLAAGWFQLIDRTDWHRPKEIKKAKYDGTFLENLPKYYFLGIPFNRLFRLQYSGGSCHSMAFALSMCFDEFEIITANLKNYGEYYCKKTNQKDEKFEHTFLVVNLEGKKMVIDTTWGMITDYETYDYIFDLQDIKTISSEDIKHTEIYKFMIENKYLKGPSYESEIKKDEEFKRYSDIVEKHMDLCQSYNNEQNPHLQDFFNRCIFRTSNNTTVWHWRLHQQFEYMNVFTYPTIKMESLVDDEFDNNLFSSIEKTNIKNQEIKENYHKQQLELEPMEEKDKQQSELHIKKKKRLFRKIFKII